VPTPLVSVVVPVFNGMPYLQAAYESIVNQTYQNIEIVFVDGGSSDASLEWLHDLDDPRASVAYLDKGTPAAGTWTAATAAARGDFIKLLCQDDLLYPRAVEAQVNDLTVNPGASVAVAQRDIISASVSLSDSSTLSVRYAPCTWRERTSSASRMPSSSGPRPC
jgi:glycosyltransferase involved in cell wall biosynthesis